MIERIKQIVAQVLANWAFTGIGDVVDYNPNLYAVRVKLQPGGAITGWVPLGAQGVGPNCGLVVGPNIGDMVRIDFIDGQRQAALCGARFFNDGVLPPAVPSGEIWAVHSSGSYIKLTNDGKLTAADKAGSTAVLNADGTGTITCASGFTIAANTQINGTLKVSGDITDNSGTNARTVAGMRTQYNGHYHADPQGGNTGTPSASM